MRGELGISYHSNRPVIEVLLERLWNTVLLVGVGQVLAIVIGIAWACWPPGRCAPGRLQRAGRQPGGLEPAHLLAGDHPAVPRQPALGLPIGGKTTPGELRHGLGSLVDLLRHLILPTLTFTIVFIGEYMLIMRSTMLEVLSEDYILTANAKGLSTFQVLKTTPCATPCCPW